MEQMKKIDIGKHFSSLPFKIIIYTLSVLFVIGGAIYGALNLSTIFSGGFSSDVFVFPLMMMRKILFSTIFITLIVVALIVYGIKKPKFWYSVPIAITLIGFFWLKINISVYKAYIDKFIK